MRGRLPMARLRPRTPVRGRPTATKASPQGRPTPLTRVAARKGGRRRSRGQKPIGAAATHGHTHLQLGARKGGRWCQPHGWPPLGRVATNGQGQQRQRRRRWGKRG
ncbi:hypothetical protein GW17_00008636 [Ensete ventricosum]|nr:hypothetical protein GW17_00008636 [Ensete ventricosum]